MSHQNTVSLNSTGKKLLQLGGAIGLAFVLTAVFMLFPILGGRGSQVLDSFNVTLPFDAQNVYATGGLTITKIVTSNLGLGVPTDTLYVPGDGTGIVTYTLIVQNNTGQDLDVTITDTVPAGVVCTGVGFDPIPSGGWTTSSCGSQVVWDSGPNVLTNGTTAVLTFTASVNPAGAGTLIENTAYDITAIGPGPTFTPFTDVGATVPITVVGPIFEISKTSNPTSTVNFGGLITYTITITNVGLFSAGSYSITDIFPNGTGFISATPLATATVSSSAITWTAGALASGVSTSVDFTVEVTGSTLVAGDAIVNSTYSVSGTDAVGAPVNSSTFGSPISVTLQSVITLTTEKRDVIDPVQPGDNITYTIVVTNNGQSGVRGLVVTDTLPLTLSGASIFHGGFVSASADPSGALAALTVDSSSLPNVVMTISNSYVIPANQAVTFTVVMSTPSPLPTTYNVTNTVVAGLSSLANLTLNISGTFTEATAIVPANLITLSKTVAPSVAASGDAVTYTVTLTNSGTGVANVSLADVLPTVFNSLVFPGTVPSIAVPGGQSTTYNFSALVGSANPATDLLATSPEPFTATFGSGWSSSPVYVGAPTTWSNLNYIPAPGFGTPPLALIGNFAVTQDDTLLSPVVNASACTLVTIEFNNDFFVYDQNYGTVATVEVGNGVVTNTVLTMQNFSDQTNKVLDITGLAAGQSSIQVGFHFVSPNSAAFVAQTDYWALDNVAIRCQAAAANDTTLYIQNVYSNTVITATYGASTSTVLNVAPVTVQATSITITKVANWGNAPAAANVGDVITYTYYVTNTGTVPVSVTTLIDDRIAGLAKGNLVPSPNNIPSAFQVGANVAVATKTYTVTLADLVIDPSWLTNTVTATAISTSRTATATDQLATPITFTPTITMTKVAAWSSAPSAAAAGDVITYTYYITNTSGVTVVLNTLADDRIPGNLLSTTPLTLGPNGGGSDSTNVFTNHTVTNADINGAISTGFIFTNTATASGVDGLVGTKPATATAQASVPLTFTKGISVLKVANVATADVGDTITYTFYITNSGSVTLTAPITLYDPLLGGVFSVTGSLAPGVSNISIATLVVDQSVISQADQTNGLLTNTVIVSGNNLTFFPASVPVTDTDSAVVDIQPTFTFSFTKDFAPGYTTSAPANVNDPITYTFTVTNTGNITITSAVVSDPSLPGSPFVIPGPIAPGATSSFTPASIVVSLSLMNAALTIDSNNPTHVNTATVVVTSSAAFVNSQNTQSTASVPLTTNVTLVFTKTATWLSSPGPARVGDVITYNYIVENTGAITYVDLTIDDDQLGNITGTMLSFSPGQIIVMTRTRVVTSSDLDTNLAITNVAVATADTVLPSPFNQVVVSDTQTVPLTYTFAVSITKLVAPSTPPAVDLGDVVTYTFLITNNSDMIVNALVTDDRLPGTIIQVSGLTPPGQGVNTSSAVVTHTITQNDITMAPVGGVVTLTNIATVLITDTQVNTTATSVSTDTANVQINFDAGITVTKTAAPTALVLGGNIVYTFEVTNTSVAFTLTNVVLTDPRIPFTWTIGTLSPNTGVATSTTYATQPVGDAPVITNTATVNGVTSTSTPFTATAQATATVIITPSPGLSITKSVSPLVTNLDQPVTYTYSISNPTGGVITLTNMADDRIPSISVLNCFGGGIQQIPFGGTPVFTCSSTVTFSEADLIASAANGFLITNTFTSTSTDFSGLPGVSTATATVALTFTKGISIEKTPSTPGPVFPGDVITYTLRVTNSGNITLHNVSLVDPLGTVSPPISTTLPAGASTSGQYTYTFTLADANNGGITNTATVTGFVTTANVATATNTASAFVVGQRLITLTVGKTDVVDPVQPGDNITYTIVITNNGTHDISSLIVTDTLPLALVGASVYSNSFVSASASPAGANTALITNTAGLPNVVLTFPGYIVTKGSSVVVTIVMSTPNPLPTTFTVTNQVAAGLTVLTDTTLVTTGDFTETTTIQPLNVIALSKAVRTVAGPPPSPPSALPGEAVDYTIHMTNTGTGVADITLTDVIPTVFNNDLVFTPNPTFALAGGQSATYQFSAIVGDVIAPTDLLPLATEPFTTAFANGWSAAGAGTAPINWGVNNWGISPSFGGFPVANIGNALTAPASTNVLLSPSVDASLCGLVSVEFDNDFFVYNQDYGSVAVVEVNGTPVLTMQDFSDRTYKVLDITTLAAGNAAVQVGFRFSSSSIASSVGTSDYWAIDNVRVRCQEAATTDTTFYSQSLYSNTTLIAGYGASTTTVTDTAPVIVLAPAITMTKTASWASAPAPANFGDTITYTFRITNTGTVAVDVTALADNRLTGLSPASLVPAASPLAVGASTTATIVVSHTQADMGPIGSVVNTATITVQESPGVQVRSLTVTYVLPVTFTPQISLTKSVTWSTAPAAAGVGDTLTYTYRITNNSTVDVRLTSLTDDRIPGNLLTTPPITLAPGASITEQQTVVVSVATLFAYVPTLTNTAVVTGEDIYLNQVGTDSDTATVPLTFTQSIAVDKQVVSSGGATAGVGDTLTYTFLITNAGSITLTSAITLDDALLGAPVILPGNLAPAAAISYVASLVVDQSILSQTANGILTNTVIVSGQNTTIFPSSPPATATTTASIPISVTFNYVFTKTASPTSGSVGDVITYFFEIENTGTITLNGVVNDPGLGVSIPVGPVSPGATNTSSSTLLLTSNMVSQAMVANPITPTLVNTATAVATPTMSSVASISRTDTATVTLTPLISISLQKSATWATSPARPFINEVITYNFTIQNTGDFTLTTVNLVDPLLGVGVIASTTNLGPGQSVVFTLTRPITSSDLNSTLDLVNTAVVSGFTAFAAPFNQATATDTLSITLDRNLGMLMTKSVAPVTPPAVNIGDVATYTYRITNTSDVIVNYQIYDDRLGVVSSGTLPPSWNPSSAQVITVPHTINTGDIILPAVGGVVTLTNNATALITDTQFITTAIATAVDSASVQITFNAGISLTKSVLPVAAFTSDVVTYTFQITNTGGYTLNYTLDDPKIGLNTSAVLGPFTSTTIIFPYTILVTDVPPVTFTNVATVTGVTVTSPTFTATAVATATVIITPAAVLDLEKTASPNPAPLDTNVIYTYRMTNSTVGSFITATAMADDRIPAVSIPNCFFGVGSIQLLPGSATSCVTDGTGLPTPGSNISPVVFTEADLIASAANGFQITNTLTVTSSDGIVTVAYTTTATTQLTFTESISLLKVADTGGRPSSFPGDVVTYSFYITNTGNITLHDVSLVDPLGTTTPVISNATMPAGSSLSAVLIHTVTVTEAVAGGITNTAVVTGFVTTAHVATATNSSTAFVLAEQPLPPVTIVPDPFPSPMAQIPAFFTATFATTPSLSSNPISYTWSFGEGSGCSALGSPLCSHTYPTSTIGLTFTVRVTAVSASGYSTSTATLVVTVLDTPITSITATNTSPIPVRQPVTLTVVAGGSPAPTNVEYSWTYGNGEGTVSPIFTTTNNVINYQNYLEPGVYTATAVARNTSSIMTATTIVTVTPGITINKYTTPSTGSTVVFSETITYTIVVTNVSGIQLTDVTITDTLDANVVLVSASGAVNLGTFPPTVIVGGGVVTVSTLTLFPNGVLTATIVVTVNNTSGTITNTAFSRYTQPAYSPPLNNTITVFVGPSNSVTHTIVTPAPTVRISKYANPPSGSNVTTQDYITYTLLITNEGTIAANNVLITDTFLSYQTYVGPESISAPFGLFTSTATSRVYSATTLPANQTYTITFRVQVAGSGVASGTVISNVVVGSVGFGVITSTVGTTMTTHTVQVPSIVLTKTAIPSSGSSVPMNTPITYTIRIVNDSSLVANNLYVTDTFTNATYITGSLVTSGGSASFIGSNTVIFSATTVPANASYTVTFAVLVSGTGIVPGVTQITNTVIGSSSNSPVTGTITTTVHTAGSPLIYLPIIYKNFVPGPNLRVISLTATISAVQVSIQNVGTTVAAPRTDVAGITGFWVDFYVNPNPFPVQEGDKWNDGRSSTGIAWLVTQSVPAGASLTLTCTVTGGTCTGLYVIQSSGGVVTTNFTGIGSGQTIAAQVDSICFNCPDGNGAVVETHELVGGAYDNVSGFLSSSLDLGGGVIQSQESVQPPVHLNGNVGPKRR